MSTSSTESNKKPKTPARKKSSARFAIHDEGRVATIANPRKQVLRDRLPPGVYRVEVHQSFFGGEQIIFRLEELVGERYVDLGGPAGRVMGIAEAFFGGEHKEKLARHGLMNKVFMLLHGPPGTGKTLVANEVARLAVEKGAVVLRPGEGDKDGDGLSHLHKAVAAIREISPDQVVMFQIDDGEGIFEYEEALIAMLDGEQQQDNVLWTVTTNYPQRVTDRVMSRTRRIQFQFPFGPPSEPMRRRYLEAQGIAGTDLEQYVVATKGMTIDQIAGLVNSTVLFGQPADEVLNDKDIRQQVRAQRLDYTAYMENYYGADRKVDAVAQEIEDGWMIDPNSGRKIRKPVEEKITLADIPPEIAMAMLLKTLMGGGQQGPTNGRGAPDLSQLFAGMMREQNSPKNGSSGRPGWGKPAR